MGLFDGFLMGGGGSGGGTVNTLPEYLQGAARRSVQRVEEAADQPFNTVGFRETPYRKINADYDTLGYDPVDYQPIGADYDTLDFNQVDYQGIPDRRVAGLSGTQQQAQQQFSGALGYNPAQRYTDYMNPYMDEVVDRGVDRIRESTRGELQGIGGNAAQSGAFGGTRHALREAEALDKMGQSVGDFVAQQRGGAYQSALDRAFEERGTRADLAQQQYQMGDLERQIAQQRFDERYTGDREQRDFELQQELAARDFGIEEQRGLRDWELQQAQDERDFELQQALAGRNFDIEEQRAQRQWELDQAQAMRDWRQQQAQMRDQHYTQELMARRDYPYQQANFQIGALGGVPNSQVYRQPGPNRSAETLGALASFASVF